MVPDLPPSDGCDNAQYYGGTVDFNKPPANGTAVLANSAYTGSFHNSYFGKLEIADQNGQLVLRIGPKPLEFALKHFDRDTFFYQPSGEMAGGPMPSLSPSARMAAPAACRSRT